MRHLLLRYLVNFIVLNGEANTKQRKIEREKRRKKNTLENLFASVHVLFVDKTVLVHKLTVFIFLYELCECLRALSVECVYQ